MSHRGKKVVDKKTAEAICVTDADAMAHFDSVPALFYLAFVRQNKSIDEATTWLKHKLDRSWNKLSAEGKEIIRDRYEASQVLLGGFELWLIRD